MNTEVNTEGKLTHINDRGEANMVDVSEKADTKRVAIAEGFVNMRPETLSAIVEDGIAKGDVFADARIAGIMAAKKTSALIPLCHPLMLTKVAVDLTPVWGEDGGSSPVTEGLAGKKHTCGIKVQAMASLVGKTGVEMEALTAVSVACLTIYDMCKAIDKGMEITDVRLLKKEGGKSGTWQRG